MNMKLDIRYKKGIFSKIIRKLRKSKIFMPTLEGLEIGP